MNGDIKKVLERLYLSNTNVAEAIKILEELQKPSIPIYGQRDPRWADMKLGYSSSSTIGSYGCLLCVVAMMASDVYQEEITPPMANERLKEVGGFVANTAYMYLGKVWEAFPKLEGKGIFRYPYPKSAEMFRVDEALENKIYCVIQVDLKPSTTNLDEHWVLLTNKISNEAYTILDPWMNGEFQMPPAYAKPGWEPKHCIFSIVLYGVK